MAFVSVPKDLTKVNTIIPFKDRFDNTLMLYALMSSKPEDVEKREKLGIKGRDDS